MTHEPTIQQHIDLLKNICDEHNHKSYGNWYITYEWIYGEHELKYEIS